MYFSLHHLAEGIAFIYTRDAASYRFSFHQIDYVNAVTIAQLETQYRILKTTGSILAVLMRVYLLV